MEHRVETVGIMVLFTRRTYPISERVMKGTMTPTLLLVDNAGGGGTRLC